MIERSWDRIKAGTGLKEAWTGLGESGTALQEATRLHAFGPGSVRHTPSRVACGVTSHAFTREPLESLHA